MKKTLLLITLFSVLSWSAYGQNFLQVTQANLQQQVKLSQDQALEVKLPSTPSTGFGWYPANSNAVVKQVGNWEFITDNPANPIGASGTQVTHFVSVAAGTAELELLYKRPWEDVSQATASYKITIVSEGAYTGKEVKPYVPAEVEVAAEQSESNESTRALPAAFTWLGQNMMTPCKNQGSCGSCWSFAACGAFESVVKIWDNVSRDMSEQWLVNCTPNMDCGGGMFPGSMFKSTGCVYEVDEKYKGVNGTCKSTYPYHEKPVGYKQLAVNPTTAQIKQAIYDYGPVWAAIDAGTNFQNYKSGVMTQTDGTDMNHAIVLCGWDDATSSWVLRNSWGTSWGENQGYMRIKWGISVVGKYGTYFDYKGIINHNTTGISDIDQNSSVQVFPNPSNGVFTFAGLENENRIEVYDFVGNLVYQAASKGTNVSVDLKAKSQGMYMYKVIGENGTKTGKLMVY